jgi:molybdopterin converting factor small subunit
MKVVVKLGAPLSRVVGVSKVTLTVPQGTTVADLLEELRKRYPEFDEGLKGKGLPRSLDRVLYSVFLNARPVPWERVGTTSLGDGDRLYLFLPVAGG